MSWRTVVITSRCKLDYKMGFMETFIESVCLHGFKVVLIESSARRILRNTKRYIVDEDLCEF